MSARSGRSPWLRWAARDLRRHWIAVVAIALVLAIGIGVYAGLGSTSTWRRASNDASFSTLAMHDLRVSLNPGTFTDQGTLEAALSATGFDDVVAGAEERLVVDSQIDASTGAESVLAAARLVGMGLADATTVDRLWISDGEPTLAGSQAVIETKFARHWDLPLEGTITVAGDQPVDYRGFGMIPEDFFYEGPEGTLLAEGELAPVYLPLASAQQVTGRGGQVNDLVLTLREGADRDAVADALAEAVDEAGVGAAVTTREEADAIRVLYEDIDNDQRFWNALAGLVLLAAALAAFNLISRIVEAQRREIGIGMALGVPRHRLAIRPMLVGAQVAVLGVLAGIGVGMLVGGAMGDLLERFLPLPIHLTPFQFDAFARAAAIGLLIPLAASALPVWRAVRVEPVEAMRTGHLAAKASRLTDWTAGLRLPGSSLSHLPVRNVLRTPRRTVLTAVGVGAAITALIAVLGLLDSFGRSVDDIDAEMTRAGEDRLLVQLDTFHPAGDDTVSAIADRPGVDRFDTGLRLPATAVDDAGEPIELLVELVDTDTSRWTPTTDPTGGDDERGGIVLARKAADDLDVGVGDRIRLEHLLLEPSGAFTTEISSIPVGAIHANPMRPFAFMDLAEAERFGLAGLVNFGSAYPTPDSSRADLQRDLFGQPGVTSTQSVARIGEAFDEALAQFVGFLVITASAVLVLALLIAFNATRITVEERRREHATMRAFGLPVRTVMGVVVKESVLIGLLATAIGVLAGLVFLEWMLRSLASTTLPDLGIEIYLSPTTVVVGLVVGVVAVALAPLFLVRRVRTMSIPDTLRVME